MAPPGWPLRAVGAVAILPMFVWPAMRAADGEVWVTALDVGQGSALLVETKQQVWLYDAGPRYSADTDAGERLILPYLRHRGIGKLDGLIVSHLDNDHSGGAASILRAVPVDRVVSSIASGHPVLNARADAERCAAGMQWTAGTLMFAVLHPALADYEAKRSDKLDELRGTDHFRRHAPAADRRCAAGRRVGHRRARTHAARRMAGGAASRQPQFVQRVAARYVGRDGGGRAGWLSESFSASRRGGHCSLSRKKISSFFGPITRARCNGASRSMGQVRCSSSRETQARYWHNRPPTSIAQPSTPSSAHAGGRRLRARRNSGTARAFRWPLNCPLGQG